MTTATAQRVELIQKLFALAKNSATTPAETILAKKKALESVACRLSRSSVST